jgi:ubiquinone/menaquinone biosynthesis C-methylase UbiE
MPDDTTRIASDFDARAARYERNQWHRVCAERLVAHAAIRAGDVVLDAGAGTGFAALAAAAKTGPSGRVIGVDVSSGMLDRARDAAAAARLRNVDFVQADACDLELDSETIDVVVCAAALLYMPVSLALAEWHRLLKPGGTIGFSTMRTGYPVAGQLFRDCAAAFGVQLLDPSAALGSESAASAALIEAGFVRVRVVEESVPMNDDDFALAWESNLRSAAHGAVRSLSSDALDALRERFERTLTERRVRDASFAVARVLYAFGRKP